MKRIILLTFLLFSLSIVYGQSHKQRANHAVYTYDNGDYGHVTVQFEYQFNGTQFKINIYNVLVEGSSKMATNEPELLAVLKRDNVFGKAQGWLKSVSIKYKANVAFGHPFIQLNIPISGSAYGNRTDYTFFEPTAELSTHNSEYFKQHNKNFYDETASIQASTFSIIELSFPALTEEINKYRRNLKAAEEKKAQEKKEKELADKKKQEEQKQLEEKKKKEEAEQSAREQDEKKKQKSETKQLAEKEGTKRVEEQQRTNNETIKETQIDMVEVARTYNANEKAKSDALGNAGNQTFDQWAQGNYIQGAKPLVDEFARQGNATGTYGTMGVAVAAQTGAIIGDALAARRQRKDKEAAYNYEYDHGVESLKKGNYEQAYNYFLESYRQGKFEKESEVMLGGLLLEGKGNVKQDIPTAMSIFRKYIILNEEANKKQENYYTQLAYYFLGKACFSGIGITQDFYKADEMFYESLNSVDYNDSFTGVTYYARAAHLYRNTLQLFVFQENKERITSAINTLDSPLYASNALRAVKQYILGVAYMKGAGVEKSEEKAFKYFIASTKEGNLKAFDTAKQNLLIPSDKEFDKKSKKLNNAHKLGVKIKKYHKETKLDEVENYDAIITDLLRIF